MSRACGPRRKEVFTSLVRLFGLAIGAKHAMGLARLWLPTALMKALESIARARGKTRWLRQRTVVCYRRCSAGGTPT
jgi:hypothetical protein